MARRLPLLICSLLVAGCTVGPNYHKPAVAMSERWIEPASLAPVDLRWWKSFGDPELDRLVTLAVESNPEIEEAQARIAEARANRDAAAGGTLPEVDAKGSATENQLSENGQLPIKNIPGFKRNFPLYDIGFDASWELDLWGRNRREVEAATARTAAAEWSRRDILVSLVADVVRNYLDLRKAQATLAEATAQAAANSELASLSEMRFRAGEDTGIAADEAQSQAHSSLQAVEQAKAAVTAAAYRIAPLVGVAPENIVPELRDRPAPMPLPPAAIAMGIRSDLLLRRADVRRAERELAAATADVGVATADLFPRFSLIGSLGQQARKPGDLLSSASTRFSIGPSFSWPIFSAGRIRAQIRGANARTDAASARYDKAVLEALSDSEAAANRFARSASALNAANAAEAGAHEAFDLAHMRFSRGEDDRLAMERAQLKWLEAKRRATEAAADYSVSSVALFKALGGGWEFEIHPIDADLAAQSREHSWDVTDLGPK